MTTTPEDFTPHRSGPHKQQKPILSSGVLGLIALIAVIALVVLTILLAPTLIS